MGTLIRNKLLLLLLLLKEPCKRLSFIYKLIERYKMREEEQYCWNTLTSSFVMPSITEARVSRLFLSLNVQK